MSSDVADYVRIYGSTPELRLEDTDASSADFKLQVNGNNLYVKDMSAGTELFVIDKDGKVSFKNDVKLLTTKKIDLDGANTQLIYSEVGDVRVKSRGKMVFDIDTDNNAIGLEFKVTHNNGAEDLFKVSEEGFAYVRNGLCVMTNAPIYLGGWDDTKEALKFDSARNVIVFIHESNVVGYIDSSGFHNGMPS